MAATLARFMEGFRVGHWTDARSRTGCTVVLPPEGNVASCEVRGSSPGSREIEQLATERRLTEVHAVLLTGGSAFGLAAATGVVEWLAERGVGYDTAVARVPIVPAAVVFDLGTGDPDVRPGAEQGRSACEAATEDGIPTGLVGAGAGATVGKWAGLEHRSDGGLGIAHAAAAGMEVAALAVVNAVGDVVDEDGTVVAGTTSPSPAWRPPGPPGERLVTNTVLALVATRAALDKRQVRWLASRAADGVTVSVRPAHTQYDGDIAFAVCAPGEHPQEEGVDVLGHLATQATAGAVRAAVRPGAPPHG